MSDQNEFGHADYPLAWGDADNLSQTSQRWYVSLIVTELALACLVALGSDLLKPEPYHTTLAYFVFWLLVAMVLVQAVRLTQRSERGWFKGRAMAESLKTLTWRYMMRVDPFGDRRHAGEEAHHPGDQHADEHFLYSASTITQSTDRRHIRITPR